MGKSKREEGKPKWRIMNSWSLYRTFTCCFFFLIKTAYLFVLVSISTFYSVHFLCAESTNFISSVWLRPHLQSRYVKKFSSTEIMLLTQSVGVWWMWLVLKNENRRSFIQLPFSHLTLQNYSNRPERGWNLINMQMAASFRTRHILN